VLGPSLSSATPVTLLYAVVLPEDAMAETIQQTTNGLSAARVSLAIGAAVAAAVYLGIVLGIRAAMVRGFDFTVRKLAGTK
jgi:hypothetical protein